MGKRRGRAAFGTEARTAPPSTPTGSFPPAPKRAWLRLAVPAALLAAAAFAVGVWYLRRPPRSDADARLAIARLRPQAGGLNLVVVTLDTTRADRLGCYGFEGIETPN